jgi:hypothetical protein
VGTWHTAKSLEPTLSVAFDLLNAKNFSAFLRDVWHFKRRDGLVKALAATGYAAMGGGVCWFGDVIGVERDPVHN